MCALFNTGIVTSGDKYNFTAGGTIAKGDVVELSTAADWTVLQGTAADVMGIGIAENAAVVGGQVEVALFKVGIRRGRSSAAIVRGALLALAAGGELVTWGAANQQEIVGKACNSTSGADEIVHFIPF